MMDINWQQLFTLQGQTVVITGGNGVLGGAMARYLAAQGARVAVLSRQSTTSSPVVQAIRAAGGTAIGLACDVLERPTLEAAAHEVQATFGPIDILINGAGGNRPDASTNADRSFFALDRQALEGVFGINLLGTIQTCQVFGQEMAARGQGVILNLASMSAVRPLTNVVAYSAAKAAVVNFTQWLAVHMAREYSPHIRVNALAPGFFLTEQNRFLMTDAQSGDLTARGQTIVAHTPQHRLGEPADLLGTLHWLVSPASTFVTGIVVPVDGGFSAFAGV